MPSRHTPPDTRQHTRKTHPHPHHRHKHTRHTAARAAPQTHATGETPHQTPRKLPPPQPADPSPEWRGTAPRTLSQEWRGATHHQNQRAPSQEWSGTASGALSQEWRGNTHSEPTAESKGPRPTKRPTSARSGEGPPPTNTGGPQPGVAGSHTQDPDPQRGVAGDHPPPPAANHNQGRQEHAQKQHDQERRRAAPPPTTTQPGRDGKPTTTNGTAKGGGGTKGAHRKRRGGPNLRGLGAQPQGFGGPRCPYRPHLSTRHKVGYARDRWSAALGGTGLGG